ncbi:MAG: hypothetical protein K2N63_01300 [Lachnospiraceae bacterium]|nr:hypothetical protein [Lachnospiraceae bacterium]
MGNLNNEDPVGKVLLPDGFWQEYYGGEFVPQSSLAGEKNMMIREKELDCMPFGRMENLKELILHDCNLENIGYLAKARQLKKLILVRCRLKGEDLAVLAQAPALKELSLNVMDGGGLMALAGSRTLISLTLRKVEGIKLEEIGNFARLQELRLEEMGVYDGRFLGKLENLKSLDLYWHVMENLDFLPALTKLTKFHLAKKAADEKGLSAVPKLVKLKEFIYPVVDLKIYGNHPHLEKIGMAPDVVQDFGIFLGSRINSFMICGNMPDSEMQLIKDKMEQYVKIYSYGRESAG